MGFGPPYRVLNEHVITLHLGRFQFVAERVASCRLFRGTVNQRIKCVASNPNGSRAIGTILDPKGKAIGSIQKNEPFYGEVDILGKPYVTGYDPIWNQSKDMIGIYYVGYSK